MTLRTELRMIPLGRLNDPRPAVRREYPPAMKARLRSSLKEFGPLTPFVSRPIGGAEFEVLDGVHRIPELEALGFASRTPVPCLVLRGTEGEALAAALAVNAVRYNLAGLAEAEGIRRLVREEKWEAARVSRALGLSKAYVAAILHIYDLPGTVVAAMRQGKIAVGQARAIAEFRADPRLVDLLFEAARTGEHTMEELRGLGMQARRSGASRDLVRALRPRRFGKGSVVRLAPRQGRMRLVIDCVEGDSLAEGLRVAAAAVRRLR